MRTIYPIKQRHLDMFQVMLNRNAAAHNGYDLRVSGNWRVIQPYDTQDLKQIGEPLKTLAAATTEQKSSSNLGMTVTILFVIFAIAIAFLYVWVFFLGAKNNSGSHDTV